MALKAVTFSAVFHWRAFKLIHFSLSKTVSRWHHTRNNRSSRRNVELHLVEQSPSSLIPDNFLSISVALTDLLILATNFLALLICCCLWINRDFATSGISRSGVEIAMIPTPCKLLLPSIDATLWSTLSATHCVKVPGKYSPSKLSKFHFEWHCFYLLISS